jgi:Tfp pilus assembly protein PilO
MNTKINLSGLKDKVSTVALVIIAMVLLVAVLGVASYFTITEVAQLKDTIGSSVTKYDENKIFVASLEKLKADSKYYEAQQAEYDKVIAEAGSYNPVDYYVKVEEMCTRYNLNIVDIQVGDMVPNGLVNEASTTIAVVGKEIDIRKMAVEIVSQEQIARIDTIAMAKQEDGTVAATMVIVNFTK